MKGNLWKRAAALTLAALLVTGGVPLQSVADLFDDMIVTAYADGEITQIISTDAWNSFAQSVNSGNSYDGVTVTLGADITVSNMVGTSTTPFKGTFCGSGHTLTLDLTSTGEFCAPFRYVDGATICGLTTTGNVNAGTNKYASGLIGQSSGTVNIKNCSSSVNITSNVAGDGTHAGFIGVAQNGTHTMTNCLFDGSISGSATTNCGGFVGWRNGTINITNCLMNGTLNISVDSNSATFSRGNGTLDIKNSYYKTSYGNVQGTSVGSMTNEQLVEKLGSAWKLSGDDILPETDSSIIDTAVVSGVEASYTTTGSALSIAPVLTALDGTVLTENTHYTTTVKKDGVIVSEVKDPGEYTYTFTAVNGSGYSGTQSVSFSVFLSAPTNLKQTACTATTAALSWEQTGSISSWTVEYDTDSSFGTPRSVSANTNSTTLSSLTNETTYYVRVKAVSGSLDSGWSNTATVYTTEKVWIGIGSTGSECFLPTNHNWEYDVSQQFFRSTELNTGACAITSIDFMNVSNIDRTRNMDIYMVHTDKTSASDSEDWVSVTENDKVFSGSVTFKAGAWSTVEFDNSFIYNGTKNIAVIVNDKTGTSPGTTYFRTYSAYYGSGLYAGRSSGAFDPINGITNSNSGGRLTYKNAVRFAATTDTHTITADGGIANGSVTVSREKAVMGDTVTVTPTADDGYFVKSVKYNGTNITPADGVYSFEMPNEDVTVTAEFTDTPQAATVVWKNYDGSTLETDENVQYGTTPKYDGAEPTKPSTDQYAYSFAGWSPEITDVTGDVTYTAQFDENDREYTVTWKNYDGSTLETDENVKYGTTPTYNSAEPTKAATDQHTYSFAGWSPEIESVKGDVTYTAQFDENLRKYTITWKNDDGSVLRTDENVEYGTMPSYGTDPTKADDEMFSYSFIGWTPSVVTVSGNATYTAQFSKEVSASHFSKDNATTYTIHDAVGWTAFCEFLKDSSYNGFSGKTVKLGADISVTTMAGSSSNRFKGTFDGAGHTLTVNYTASSNDCAPFLYIDGATFRCLKVSGSISTGYRYAAGIAAHSYGNCTIKNCISSIAVNSTISDDGTHAGFIAVLESGVLNIKNCLFDGSITGSETFNCGGFVGWRNNSLTFTNCLMAGTMTLSTTDGSATFNRHDPSTLKNCYYRTEYGSTQGSSVGSMTNDQLAEKLGSDWTVSGSDVLPVMDAADLCTTEISGVEPSYYVTGSEIAITPKLTALDGTVLTEGTHYTKTLTKDGVSVVQVKDIGEYTYTFMAIDGGGYSGRQTVSFTVTFPVPKNVKQTGYTDTSAALSWSQDGNADSWIVEYSTDSSFSDPRTVTVSTTTSTLTGLTNETTYYVRVKAVTGDLESAWSSTATVGTTDRLWLGVGSERTDTALPTNVYYNYSVTQQIYTTDELGSTECAFVSVGYMNTSDADRTRNIDIYMVHTDASGFTSNQSWIPVTQADKVFSGSVTFKRNAWTSIPLDKSFIYNGTQNVAVLIDDNTGSYENAVYFRVYKGSGYPAMRLCDDNTDYDPIGGITNHGLTIENKSAIRFTAADAHTITVDGNITNGSVTLSREKAAKGDTVTVTLSADDNYYAKSVSVNGGAVAVTKNEEDETFSFTMPDADAEVTAEFAQMHNVTVTWKNYDGTTIKTDSVLAPSIPVYSGDEPTRPDDKLYSYTFEGWEPDGIKVYEDTDITAVYKASPLKLSGDVTVCDQTNTYNRVPYYAFYNDYSNNRTAQIYPAERLTDLNGRKIYSMTFYSCDDKTCDVKGMQVYLAEVENTEFSDMIEIPADAVKVYSGDYAFTSNENTIEFEKPYEYNGGNLLVVIKNTEAGDYTNKMFYGEYFGDQHVSHHAYGDDDGYICNYLAKCTFGFVDDNYYTVTWKGADGSVIETDEGMTYGETPVFNGAMPADSEDDFYTYYYKWDKKITPVTGNTTYTLVLVTTPKFPYSLTVCAGSYYSLVVPYKSDYNSLGLTGTNQIYPASMLTGLADRKLWSMTFYARDNYTIDVKGLKIYLAEVDFTTFSGKYAEPKNGYVYLYDISNDYVTSTCTATQIEAVKVFDSDYDFKQGENLIKFDTPFEYGGGNLLVIIENTTTGANSDYMYFSGDYVGEGVSQFRYGADNTAIANATLSKCTFGYVDESRYTVTWRDADKNVIETDADVPSGSVPSFNGETDVSYWTDGTNTYSNADLPAVTADVTYTAVFPKTLAVGTVFYKGDVVDFGNKYFVYDDHSQQAVANDVGTAVISSLDYNTTYSQYCIGIQGRTRPLWVSFADAGDDVGIKVAGGSGTYDDPFTFIVYKDAKYTVKWIGTDGTTVLETDESPFGSVPEFNGTIPVTGKDKVYWSDGTNLYLEDELPIVIADATYTARIKHVKSLEVGTVFTIDDEVEFDNKYFNDWDEYGAVSPWSGIGTASFREPVYDDGVYWIEDMNSGNGFGVTSDDFGSSFAIKVVAGDGTYDKPFLFKTIPENGEENSFRVVCESNGKFVNDIYAASGKTISAPSVPENTLGDDYAFGGWRDENGKLFNFNTPITADITLTAYWAKGAALKGSNLILGDDIGINFFMTLSDDVLSDPNAKVVFTIPNGDNAITKEVLVSDITNDDSNCVNGSWIFPCFVAAKEMTVPITVTTIYTNENGEQTGDEYTYTVKHYADYILENDGFDAETIALVKSMLNYGTAAQVFFGTNTDKPANASLDDADRPAAPFTEAELTAFENMDVQNTSQIDGAPFTYEGSQFVLNSKTTYKMRFSSELDGYIVTYNGNVLDVEESGEYRIVTIADISPEELFDDITLMFTPASGSPIEVTFNPASYILLAMEEDDEALINVVTALYRYYEAAVEYANMRT